MKQATGEAAPGKYALIWDVVRRIPRGRVASYGQVARLAGLEAHARLAGYALHASVADRLPWHRVVNAEGRLSLARTDVSAGVTQRMRSEQEGVRFDARGRVDMARHRWEPAAPPRKKRGPRRGVQARLCRLSSGRDDDRASWRFAAGVYRATVIYIW